MQLLDKNDQAILTSGCIESQKNNTKYTITEEKLSEGSRIVGFRSGRRGVIYNWHYDF